MLHTSSTQGVALDIDVVIIGAGPAGCCAASILHHAGLRVEVVERDRFPRFVIGESLLPHCMDVLQEAHLLEPLAARGYLRKPGAVFLRDTDVCDFDFGDQFTRGFAYTWQVPREDFDATLARAVADLGVPVRFGTRVIDAASGTAPWVEVFSESGERRRIDCRFILDASGYGRVLPRLFGLDRPSTLPLRRSVFTHVRGDQRPSGDDEGKIWIAALARDAWTWTIPFADGRTSIGVVASPSYFDDLPSDPQKALLSCMARNPQTKTRLANIEIVRPVETIDGYSIGVSQIYGTGYCLVGNATEFLDPVFSSGVCLALESALRASRAIIAELGGETVDWHAVYGEPMARGVDTFRAYVDAWYDGTLPNVFFSHRQNAELKSMVCSLLAGYAWDLDNPYVREPRRKCAQLARIAATVGVDIEPESDAALAQLDLDHVGVVDFDSASTNTAANEVPEASDTSVQTQVDATDYDVVICGGGLAGLLLARQLRRELATLRVAVIEPSTRPLPEACHKVGESTVELGSSYLDRLGLHEYLRARHLIKNGLRFYPGGGHLPLEQRTEIGPVRAPLVTSYQIDRGRFENDVRGMVETDKVALFEGWGVRELDLGSKAAAHRVTLTDGATVRSLSARWVVDATGREALIRPELALTRGVEHAASSSWFRVPEKIDVAELVPQTATAWHARDPEHRRWLSTVHLMGEGYWLWLIPLASGYTSIGVVVHDHVHAFDTIATLDATRAWIDRHEPVLGKRLQGVPVADFMSLGKYSYGTARAWSVDRWATVGEAGAFGDPLYSPGTDFIAYANSLTVEAIRADFAEDGFAERVSQFNQLYRSLFRGALETVQHAAPVYGHASAMAAKLYWDNFSYWSFSCPFFMQKIYTRPVGELPAYLEIGARFVELHGYVQRLVSAWARLAQSKTDAGHMNVPSFPSILIDAHRDLLERFTPEQTLAKMRQRVGQGEQIVAELIWRVVGHVGPEIGARLIRETGLETWSVPLSPTRLAIDEKAVPRRRHTAGDVARDVERSLAFMRPHREANTAWGLLETMGKG